MTCQSSLLGLLEDTDAGGEEGEICGQESREHVCKMDLCGMKIVGERGCCIGVEIYCFSS